MSTYRASPKMYFVGALFFLVGTLIQIDFIYAALLGKPIPVTSNGVTRNATRVEEGVFCLLPAIGWTLGLWWLLCASKFSVTISDEGIRITKFPGKVFQWRWEEVKYLSLVSAQSNLAGNKYGEPYYVIGDERQTTSIYSVRNKAQFVDEIEKHIGYLIG